MAEETQMFQAFLEEEEGKARGEGKAAAADLNAAA